MARAQCATTCWHSMHNHLSVHQYSWWHVWSPKTNDRGTERLSVCPNPNVRFHKKICTQKTLSLFNRASRSPPGRFGCTEGLEARCCCIYRSHVPLRYVVAMFSTPRKTDRQTDRQTYRQTDTQRERERETETETETYRVYIVSLKAC